MISETPPPPQPPFPRDVPPDDNETRVELRKLQYSDVLDRAIFVWKEAEKARLADIASRGVEKRKAERDSLSAMEGAYLEVIKGRLERSVNRVEIYLGLITTLITAYGVLLGLQYAPDEANPTWHVAVPAILLAIALASGGGYLISILPDVAKRQPLPSNFTPDIRQERLVRFDQWVRDAVGNNAWALRLSLFFFVLGLLSLPLGFVEVPSGTWDLELIGSLVILGIVLAFAVFPRRTSDG